MTTHREHLVLSLQHPLFLGHVPNPLQQELFTDLGCFSKGQQVRSEDLKQIEHIYLAEKACRFLPSGEGLWVLT
jgi:hypothetical protein